MLPDRTTAAVLALAGLGLLLASTAVATIAGGGGSGSTDCLAVFDAPVTYPTDAPTQVRCVDGDAACDADLSVNGVCEIKVSVCVNSTAAAVAGCTLSGVSTIVVEHALDNGDPKFDPDFQAVQTRINGDFTFPATLADDCTVPSSIRVPIKGPLGTNKCSRRTKKLKLATTSTLIQSRLYTDKDTLKLTCDPAPLDGCDPQTLFSSTFDRIQKQVFNQNCAVSGCHDSNTHQAGLLLEAGATPASLINVIPSNAAAAGAGWKRIDQTSPTLGAPETSFLFHKVTGDLPDASYGERMPRGRPKLNRTLRDLLEKWIRAGAPATEWVPGTF